jgi:hypothetical protein
VYVHAHFLLDPTVTGEKSSTNDRAHIFPERYPLLSLELHPGIHLLRSVAFFRCSINDTIILHDAGGTSTWVD